MKKLKFSALLATLPFAGARAEEEYLQYDFSKPEEVYKATLSESVTRLGISASVMYEILQTGQIIIVNDHPNSKTLPWLTTAGIIINAPPDQAFSVVTDMARYPEFMPQVEKTEVKKVGDHIEHIFYELGIKVLFVNVTIPYSVYHYHQPPTRTDWVMAGGDFEANCGAYEVVPIPGSPNRCLLFYTSYSLPRNSLVNSLFNKIPMLDMMINLSTGTLVVTAMKKRIETLYTQQGGQPVPPPGHRAFTKLLSQHATALSRLSSRGKVVIIEDSSPMFYNGGIVVKKPLDEVYYAVTHLDEVTTISKQYSAKYVERSETGARVEYKSIIPLMIDFTSQYVLKYTFEPPNKVSWVGEPGGDLKGLAGSWELVSLDAGSTLVIYRNTSDLASQGYMMRKTLEVEPTFEQAIQACQTQYVINDLKRWCEADAEQRQKLAEKAK